MRLTNIELRGFKGIEKTYDLSKPLVLLGPNGSGKSAVLDGIIYAISGDVPAGKALDLVSQCFPPDGGSVHLANPKANISRGICRDLEKKKNSEVLENNFPAEFAVNPALLRIANFLSLSANQRREFIMSLAGEAGGEEDLRALVELEFSKLIGGKAATVSWMVASDDPKARCWLGHSGPSEVFNSLKPSESRSAFCQELGQVAKEMKLLHRRDALAGKQAIKELEPEAQKAKIHADGLPAALPALEAIEEQTAVFNSWQERLFKAASTIDVKRQEYAAKKLALDNLAGSGNPVDTEPPKAPEPDPRIPRMLAEIEGLERDKLAIGEQAQALASLGRERAEKKATHKSAGERLEKLKSSKAFQLAALVREIPDAAHPVIPKLRSLVESVTSEIVTGVNECERSLATLAAELEAVAAKIAASRSDDDLKAHAVQVEEKLHGSKTALAVAEKTEKEGQEKFRYDLARWTNRQRGIEDAKIQLARGDEQLKGIAKIIETSEAEYAAIAAESSAEIDQDQLLTARKLAIEEAKVCQEAAGAWKAYEAALKRSREEKIQEETWNLAEEAIQIVREVYVGRATHGIQGDIQSLFERMGRLDRVFLELENERGRPIFEFGLCRGDKKIPFQALSNGEQALFGVALSLAIARRLGGLKTLLLEADALDRDNFCLLLGGLEPVLAEFDCVVIAKADIGCRDLISGAWNIEVLA